MIDTATGTVKAKARFNNAGGALFPNQFVNARMLVDVLCNVVTVPTTAVRHGSTGDFVFTLQPDHTAKMVMVTTGPGTGETISITKGLQPGGTVITEGGDRLRDGSAVNLPGDKPAGGSGFSAAAQRGGGGGQGGQGRGGFGGGSGGRRFGAAARAAAADADKADKARLRPPRMRRRDSDSETAQNQALPTVQVPPGACSGGGQATQGPGGKGGRGRFGARAGRAASPASPVRAPGGAFVPGQGFQGRRAASARGQSTPGQGGPPVGADGQPRTFVPGQGGFRRRGPPGQAPGAAPGGPAQGQNQG